MGIVVSKTKGGKLSFDKRHIFLDMNRPRDYSGILL